MGAWAFLMKTRGLPSALTLMVYSAMMVSLASPGVNLLLTVAPIEAAVALGLGDNA